MFTFLTDADRTARAELRAAYKALHFHAGASGNPGHPGVPGRQLPRDRRGEGAALVQAH
jgi:hypothetical protein